MGQFTWKVLLAPVVWVGGVGAVCTQSAECAVANTCTDCSFRGVCGADGNCVCEDGWGNYACSVTACGSGTGICRTRTVCEQQSGTWTPTTHANLRCDFWIGRTELTLRTVSPTGVKVDLPVDPQGRRVIEMELLRGSLARQDFSLMHDSKSCPPASDGYGNPLVNPAPPGGTAGTWVSSDFSTLECAADEVPVMDRQAALYGVSMQPPVNWATVSGAATESSVGNQVVWMYGVAWSITLGGLLPFEKGMSIAFDATAAEGDLASGVHETVLTISYRQSNNLGASGDSESFPGCGGLLAASGEQGKLCADLTALELLLRFKVVQPSYFLLLAPSGLNEQMAAGSSADYTLQLYNAMPGPLDWHIRCADLPTAAGVIRLAVDTSTVPCGGGTPSGTGTLEFQGEGSLTVSVTAPDVVQTDPYNYVLHIPATNENGATIEQTLPITVVVVAEMLADRSLTRLDIPTSVTAGAPMVVEVRAKDQYNNSILTAGLSFSMDVTAANPESPWATARTFLSRFTVDGYIIETDAIPQQGAYSLSVTNSDNQERIGGGSNPSFEIQVEPITCSGTNVAPDESGLVCVCSPGYGRGTNAAGLHVCVPCTDTTAGGSGTLYSSATTAGECIPCLDGTRPNAAQSACDDCPVGEAGVGGRCTACDAGKIPEANRHACEFCPAGKQPNEAQNDCVQCAVGSATNTGVCQACDAGKRPVDGGSRCEVCPAGKEPNEGQIDCVECAAGSATAIGVCQACGPGKMARPRATACETCPLGKAPDYNRTDCEVCPEGKVGNTGSCETCAKGKTPDESQNFCEKCPRFSTTLEAGATTCVCENNYFSRSFDIVNASDGNGAEPSLQCEKCPFGAVCEGISNSIYAKPGYWINVYQSSHGLDGDSSRSINPPQFKPVHCLKETNNCIGYCDQDGTETETPACKPVPNEATPQLEPNACKLGLTGPLCAFCEDGEYGRANLKYRKVEGTCVKCDGIDWPNAFVTYGMYTLMCTFFLFKSRRIITGRDCDIHNSSCIIGISLFFVQTMVLLPSETFGHLDFVKELAGAVSMSPDTTDQTDGKCLSFGDFYYDWLMKFSIPLYNITATVFLVFLAGLWKRSPWQGKMALFFALQSSLFAINLRAISLFFCRTDLSCGDQCPSSWLPHGHLRVDPSQSCTTHRHLAYLAVAALIFATFAFGLPALLCKSIGERMDAHRKLLRIEAYLKYGFEQGAIVLQNKDWSDMHSAEYAARDYLSVIYYPLRRQKYWWAAVWIVRPTVIATVYNARDRGSGVAFGFADWRILVVWLLMLYNCIQATVRPFKHVNESQLDSFSVLLLMSMFTVSINNDFVSAKEASLANTADRVAKFMTVVLVCLVVLATVQSKLRTVGNIKKMIARDRWRSAWSHMSGNECDPLADVGKLVDHLEEDANKKTGVLAKLTQIGIVGVKLPVFEQIDVDESGFISLNEFLEWWRVRTIRTGLADEMRGVAADLFGQFDADNSGEVDRDEFNHFLTGLREWHAKQRALMSQFEESPEARKQRIRIQREKVVENLHKHGWTESPAGWVRPVQLGTPVAGMINPLAASFEVDLPATAGATPASTVIATTAAASHSAKSAQAAGVPTVEEIFSSIDSDRSGSVCFHEFSQWWTSHGGTGSMLELAKRAFDLVAQRDGAPGVSILGLKDVMVAVAAEGWTRATDPASGRQYFVNPATGTASWLAPGVDAVGPFLERAGISRDAATVTVYTPTLTEIFEEIDVDGSGVIEYDEFADWWEQNGGSQSSLALAQEAFGLIEMRDGVPGLGFTELKEVMIAVASDDWEEAVDLATGRKYFIDPHTKQTSWLVPGVEIVGPFLQQVGITRNGVRPRMRTRSSARGATSNRGQTTGVPSTPSAAGRQRVEPAAAVARTAAAAVTPAAQTRVSDGSNARGDGPALIHAPVLDQVIATLDTTDTGQVLQSTFVSLWAERQAPGLAVMDKLKFSRPISKRFATSGGTLSTMQFRELLLTLFEEEVKSSSATELTADHMNAWLHRLLIYI